MAYDASPNQDDVSAIGITTDGGYTWTTYDPVSLPGLTNPGISMVYPTTPSTAYLVAYKRPTSTGIDDSLQEEYADFDSLVTAGSTVWFTTNKARVFRPVDMGQTWQAFLTPPIDFNNPVEAGELTFADDSKGWLLRSYGEFFYTTDGGETWVSMNVSIGSSEYSTDITFIPGANKFVASEFDTGKPDYGTKISYDGGENWQKIELYKFSYMQDYDYLSNIANVGGDNIPHTALGFRDANFGLSGSFSAQDDPNDDADLGDMGVYVYHDGLCSLEKNKIAELQIYPNPANEVLNISADNNIQSIAVFDVTGKEVISLNNLFLNQTSVDVSGLESGVYWIKVTDETGAQKSLKFLVQ